MSRPSRKRSFVEADLSDDDADSNVEDGAYDTADEDALDSLITDESGEDDESDPLASDEDLVDTQSEIVADATVAQKLTGRMNTARQDATGKAPDSRTTIDNLADELMNESMMPAAEDLTDDSESDTEAQQLPAADKGKRPARDTHMHLTDLHLLDEEEQDTPITAAELAHDMHLFMQNRRKVKGSRAGMKMRDYATADVRRLMGEANQLFGATSADQRDERIEALCMEVIKLSPTNPDPYLTLSTLYRDKNDTLKALKYTLFAAHLDTKNRGLWQDAANLSYKEGMYEQAIYCYDRAYNCDPANKDYGSLYGRALVQTMRGRNAQALTAFRTVAEAVKNDDQVLYNMARAKAAEVDKLIKAQKDAERAERYLSKAPTELTEAQIEERVVRSMSSQLYAKAIEFVSNKWKGDPASMSLSLRTRLGVCYLRLNKVEEAKKSFAPLFESMMGHGSEEHLNLYMDVIRLFFTKRHYRDVLTMIQHLLPEQNPTLDENLRAEVANINALCILHEKNAVESQAALQAARASIRKKTPGTSTMSIAMATHMSTCYREHGLVDMAKTVVTLLSREPQIAGVTERLGVLVESALIAFEERDYEKFLATSLVVLRRVLGGYTRSWRPTDGQGLGWSLRDPENAYAPRREPLDAATQLELLRKTCSVLLQRGQHNDGLRAIDLLRVALRYCEPNQKAQLRLLLADASWRVGDVETAMNNIRKCFGTFTHQGSRHANEQQALDAVDVLSVLNAAQGRRALSAVYANEFESIRKFIAREMDLRKMKGRSKAPVDEESLSDALRAEHTALRLIHGHHFLFAGSFKRAYNDYLRVYKAMSDAGTLTPLLPLLVGVSQLQRVTSRRAEACHFDAVQSFGFLHEYFTIRKIGQETHYNMARALHQLGIRYLAVPYYEKVFDFPSPLQEAMGWEKTEAIEDDTDLRREAAYNLCLIYRASGQHTLARDLTWKYLSV